MPVSVHPCLEVTCSDLVLLSVRNKDVDNTTTHNTIHDSPRHAHMSPSDLDKVLLLTRRIVNTFDQTLINFDQTRHCISKQPHGHNRSLVSHNFVVSSFSYSVTHFHFLTVCTVRPRFL